MPRGNRAETGEARGRRALIPDVALVATEWVKFIAPPECGAGGASRLDAPAESLQEARMLLAGGAVKSGGLSPLPQGLLGCVP